MKALVRWVAIVGLALVPMASAQAQAPQGSNQARDAATSYGSGGVYGAYGGAYGARQRPWTGAYVYEPHRLRYRR